MHALHGAPAARPAARPLPQNQREAAPLQQSPCGTSGGACGAEPAGGGRWHVFNCSSGDRERPPGHGGARSGEGRRSRAERWDPHQSSWSPFSELCLNTSPKTKKKPSSFTADMHAGVGWLSPLTVGRHVQGSAHRDGRPPLRDGQHLHGLPLRSAFAVPAQHGGVHALPGRICRGGRSVEC